MTDPSPPPSGGPPRREPIFQPGGPTRLAKRLLLGLLGVVAFIAVSYAVLIVAWMMLNPRW